MNALVNASEVDADLGFMARMMALCSLPRTNPGDRIRYKRVNGPYTLYMTAGGGCKLPFGNFPRLLLAWVSTEAVQTQSRELVLGRSLSEFMRALDIYTTSGGRALDKLPGPVQTIRDTLAPGASALHPIRSGKMALCSQRFAYTYGMASKASYLDSLVY